MDPSIAWYKTCSASSSSATSTSALRRGARPPDWSIGVVLNHHPKNGGEAFDPTRTGPDHIGFVMPDRAALEA
jgi:hypothetical protein